MLSAKYNAFTAATILSCILISGCSTTDSYTQAFTNKNVPAGNGHIVNANEARTFKAARIKLVQQGFAIQSLDPAMGVIKASRSIQDYNNKDVTYNIAATVDIIGSDTNSSTVRLAATQQSIMHHVYRDYWKLLFIIPLFPTGIHYENVVIKEGEVTDPKFYKSFFDGLDSELASQPQPITTSVAPTAAPTPVASTVVDSTPAAPTPVVMPVAEVKPAVAEIKPPETNTSSDGNITMTTTRTISPVTATKAVVTAPSADAPAAPAQKP